VRHGFPADLDAVVNALLEPSEAQTTKRGTPASKLTASRHIPSLDGIRALSFVVVFGSHVWGASLIPGQFGVTVFFFLSGFLITTLLREESERNGTINLGHFWLRRALRILPPLYVILLGAIGLACLVYPPGTVYGPTLAAQALFYANYWYIYGVIHGGHPEIPGSGVLWSLAVEETFYLLFPLLYLAMHTRRFSGKLQAGLLWGLCALVLAWRCVLVIALHAPSVRIQFGTDTRIDTILFGCALAVWNNPFLDQPRVTPGLWKYVVLPLVLSVLLLCAYASGTVFADTWCLSVEGAALTLAFICAVRFHDWSLFRVLNHRVVRFIGVLSYSLYLVHVVVLMAVQETIKLPHASQRGAIALGASMLIAWTIYRVVEKPCAHLRKRLTDW
jgi:peptidoglycan/LPS O-acetylase OafA/YrhL